MSTMNGHMVQFKKVTKRFGTTTVLEGVDLEIGAGEVVVLIGPSGSGKSTLLRCINALEQIDGGDLIVDGISVLAGPKKVREIRQEAGMVFQQFNLFPQLTALENVAFGPRQVRGMSEAVVPASDNDDVERFRIERHTAFYRAARQRKRAKLSRRPFHVKPPTSPCFT